MPAVEHGMREASGAGGVDVDYPARERRECALGQEAHGRTWQDALDQSLFDEGIDHPARRVDQHAKRIVYAEPRTGTKQRRDVAPLAAEPGADGEPLAFFPDAARFRTLFIQALHQDELAVHPAGGGQEPGQAALKRLGAGADACLPGEQIRGGECHQDLPCSHCTARAQHGELRRERGVHQLLAFGVCHALGVHAKAPGDQEKQQSCRKNAMDQSASTGPHFRPEFFPHTDLRPDRTSDEPGEFDQHQDDAQCLEEKEVHHQGNAEKHHQTVDPGAQCKDDQATARALRQGFRPGLLEPQQVPAQPDAGKGA